MKAAVTGATGFLGGGLVRRLLELGWDVEMIVRDPSSRAAVSLRDLGATVGTVTDPADAFEVIERSGADVVAHLATHFLKAHRPGDIGALVRSNVELGTGILEAASILSAPVVMASSFFQFSHGTVRPRTLYAATKQALSSIAAYYRSERELDVREVIFYDTYGPGDTRDKLVPLLTRAALTGEHVSLGAADQPINLTYLDDAADGLTALLSTPSPELTTIRALEAVTVGDLVAAMGRTVGRPLAVQFAPGGRVNDQPLTAGDWPTPPAWRPLVDLTEGLSRTVAGARAAR